MKTQKSQQRTKPHPPQEMSSIPNDIAFKIASLLEVADLCSLGSCSRFWRELCGSDCVWEALCRGRWPALSLDVTLIQSPLVHQSTFIKGWRGFYITKHCDMASRASSIIKFVEGNLSSESIEVNHYLKAIQDMSTMQFGFRDIELFFLKKDLHVLLNLAGLHYCIAWLGVPLEYVMEALTSSKICERQVCVKWWKLGRWLYGFRLRDESLSRNVSLQDLALTKEEEILGVLHRGAIHEVLRVQISATKPIAAPWSCQTTVT